ncbi:hypothetical protein H4F38_07085 [Pectobacterium brasiliense]|nr:hypothetical protein [Pectobacterium brasiliense]MBA0215134.1 hypothetical protein [Pectobacterium brasiliense]MBN3097519.1 hypothetical protein [Pectobacterium brasiliense]MBN3100833.1 hypothetical protein [Pectobacterium brasiliense]MBN3165488.1 hypothetical protein [Pectobacterium brasiliense]MBN3182192.1 hypothetical protein [Pectobacterium brasiliense]
MGGENNYGYVHNPMDWVDPFGVTKCPTLTHGANGEILSAKASVLKA